MRALVIGSGGREHAIAWKLAQSPLLDEIFVAPGNAGTAMEPKCQNVHIHVDDCESLVKFAKENDVKLTIVGPEAALAAGVVNAFHAAGIDCFGPSKQAAMLESSKKFCKDFLLENKIPTAKYACFTELKAAIDYVRQQKLPIVIKADGLAAGKGVIIAETMQMAEETINAILKEHKFGDAGRTIVIEEFLQGEEMSYIVMADGEHILPLASSQDHKRRDDGDAGPNTGGMGAYSPANLINPKLEKKILDKIIKPTIEAMLKAGTPYTGFLYAGLMISPKGEPKVLEYNCRLGDPETQPILLRLKSDLAELCCHGLKNMLDIAEAVWDPRPALGVVLTAGGYPIEYNKGDIIEGLDGSTGPDVKIFHAGTSKDDGHIVTNGGRVLTVTALGDTILEAQKTAYAAANKIHWPHIYFRTDIGYRAISSPSDGI